MKEKDKIKAILMDMASIIADIHSILDRQANEFPTEWFHEVSEAIRDI